MSPKTPHVGTFTGEADLEREARTPATSVGKLDPPFPVTFAPPNVNMFMLGVPALLPMGVGASLLGLLFKPTNKSLASVSSMSVTLLGELFFLFLFLAGFTETLL